MEKSVKWLRRINNMDGKVRNMGAKMDSTYLLAPFRLLAFCSLLSVNVSVCLYVHVSTRTCRHTKQFSYFCRIKLKICRKTWFCLAIKKLFDAASNILVGEFGKKKYLSSWVLSYHLVNAFIFIFTRVNRIWITRLKKWLTG